jgi:predicted deacylase
VPVATVRGRRDGPTVLMVAGVHPCEYTGIAALRRLFGALSADALSGTLVIVPCLNLPGFFGLTPRVNPADGVDAGRAFPGDPAGTPTERMVSLVWEELVRKTDYVFDVHGGDLDEELVAFALVGLTGDATADRKAEALARALSLPVLVRTPPSARPPTRGTGLRTLAANHGIPAVLTEMGSQGIVDDVEVARLVAALLRGLVHLGLLAGSPEAGLERPPVVLDGFEGVYAPVEGFWRPAVRKGARVRRGQLLGEIRDIFDEPLCQIEAERDAVTLVVATVPPRRAGSILFGLGLGA